MSTKIEKYVNKYDLEKFLDKYSDYMNPKELKELEEILKKEFIIL